MYAHDTSGIVLLRYGTVAGSSGVPGGTKQDKLAFFFWLFLVRSVLIVLLAAATAVDDDDDDNDKR